MDRRLFLAVAAGFLAGSAGSRAVRAAPAPPPLRRLRLVNVHTGESFDGPYRDDQGPIAVAMDELSTFLRDHHSGERIAMDVGVIDFLAAVMDAVGASRARILSAYRTRATNAMLARTTFGVADNSQHIYGRAIDIRLETRLEDAMHAARAMARGGVGWYPHSGFIHLDSGPVRTWTLDGGGFDHLLTHLQQLIAHSGLPLPAKVVAGRARHPLTYKERLALHRALARAEFLASHR
ncbi:MAG: YcbK family protein [Thiohalocapsa sp.]